MHGTYEKDEKELKDSKYDDTIHDHNIPPLRYMKKKMTMKEKEEEEEVKMKIDRAHSSSQ